MQLYARGYGATPSAVSSPLTTSYASSTAASSSLLLAPSVSDAPSPRRSSDRREVQRIPLAGHAAAECRYTQRIAATTEAGDAALDMYGAVLNSGGVNGPTAGEWGSVVGVEATEREWRNVPPVVARRLAQTAAALEALSAAVAHSERRSESAAAAAVGRTAAAEADIAALRGVVGGALTVRMDRIEHRLDGLLERLEVLEEQREETQAVAVAEKAAAGNVYSDTALLRDHRLYETATEAMRHLSVQRNTAVSRDRERAEAAHSHGFFAELEHRIEALERAATQRSLRTEYRDTRCRCCFGSVNGDAQMPFATQRSHAGPCGLVDASGASTDASSGDWLCRCCRHDCRGPSDGAHSAVYRSLRCDGDELRRVVATEVRLALCGSKASAVSDAVAEAVREEVAFQMRSWRMMEQRVSQGPFSPDGPQKKRGHTRV